MIRRQEVRPFSEKQIELSQNLCRPSRDRHRERAPVQGTPGAQRRIARSPGASDGDVRGARHHQPLADGRAAGARRHRRERRAGLRDRRRGPATPRGGRVWFRGLILVPYPLPGRGQY